MRGFIAFALDKPIINHMLLAFLLLLAIFSYQNIAKEIFPPAKLDQITIIGGYAGTSADVLDKMMVGTLEDELEGIAELDTVYTTIQNGSFTIFADIKSGNDNQLVLSDVKDVISNIRRDLPADMEEPVARITVSEIPLLLVAISFKDEDTNRSKLINVAKDLKTELSALEDLSKIEVWGDADEEVLITLDQKRLDAYGLDKTAVYQVISTIASIYPAGTLDKQGDHLYLSTLNGEKNKEALENTILSIDQKRVRLKDIATVSLQLEEPQQISHFNAKENISVNINKSKHGNAIALSHQIKEILKTYNTKYKNLSFDVYTDTSIWIKNRLNLVTSNIFFGLMMVFLALLLSVNARIALVVALGIPVSFMIGIISADMLGYSLNMLSLLGVLIALGMLVDEAIVVAENIHRHLEMGKPPREAALEGSLEMVPAIITATLTTVFAFLPLLIMSGEMGMFMRILPIMISIMLISSLFEAFYFLPLHTKELYEHRTIKTNKEEFAKDEAFWNRMKAIYESVLTWLLKVKKRSLVIMTVLIILGTMGLGGILKFQLFPTFDSTQVQINGKLNVNNDLYDTEKYIAELETVLLKDLDKTSIDSITAIVGFKMNQDQTFETGENLFHLFVNLHEQAPSNFFDIYINPVLSIEYDDSDMIREKLSQDISKEIEAKIGDTFAQKTFNGKKVFEELNVFVQQAGIVGNDIEIGFSHQNNQYVMRSMNKLETKLKSINGVSGIGNNANEGERELKLRVNEFGQQLGLNEQYIVSVLRGSFLKAEYAKMFNNNGLVRVKVEDNYKKETSIIEEFTILTPDKTKSVKLSDVCDFIYQKSFVKIFKEDGLQVRSIYASVNEEIITPVEVMTQLRKTLKEIEDSGIKVIIKGEEKENTRIQKELSQAGVIAMFLIFIALVWMFNSLVLPLIVISVIPLSIFGAFLGTWLMGLNLSMPGMMGVVGLAGVVVNDGLIMLDFIKGSKDYDELHHKAGMRLRPILLTSITTVLGLFTLIFFASGQSLIVQPMAVSLGFGVAWATVLNLYYVPLMYAVIYRVKG